MLRSIPLHQIRPRPNIPAGLNPLVVMAVAHSLRNGYDAGHGPCCTEPITVRWDGDTWELVEGRHRWLAAWVAGCTEIQCVAEE